MNYDDIWEYDAKEFLTNCCESEFNIDISKEFFEMFSISNYQLKIQLKSARNILLTLSESDYTFSSSDLSWISEQTSVILYSNEEKNLFFVNLYSCPDTYYIDACAFIKIFNKAFLGKNCYVFRMLDGIAIGSMRDFKGNDINNFCVTDIFHNTNMDEAINFWYDFLFADFEDISTVIIEHSPQETVSSYSYSENKQAVDDNYGQANELDCIKGPSVYMSYKQSCEILQNTATDSNVTSLDVLEQAIASEQAFYSIQLEHEPDLSQTSDFQEEYSEEAYANAEVLLREVISKNKITGG